MAGRVNVREASDAWRALQGIFCIYKPPRMNINSALRFIPINITKDLNKMRYTQPKYRVEIKGSVTGELSVSKEFDYSQHPLVLGPLYDNDDIILTPFSNLIEEASGVCVLGINEQGEKDITHLQECQLLSTYVIEGKLGVATRNFFYTGKAVEKSTWQHVTSGRLERVLRKIQSNNQRRMFDQLGLQQNSQAAYEAMSSTGLVRPRTTAEPIMYGIKLVEVGLPHFTIEVTGSNINCELLLQLVNDIGLMLRTNAHTLQLRCIRQGPFTLDTALLRKHWFLEPVLNNLSDCRPLVGATVHDHAELAPLDQYQEERRAADKHNKEQKLLQMQKRELMAERMMEEFKENEEYENYLKTLDDSNSAI